MGREKPIFINGKPVYGIVGNVWHWLSDWYDPQLTGGVNPQGPATGSLRVQRGGSSNGGAGGLRSIIAIITVLGIAATVLGFAS